MATYTLVRQFGGRIRLAVICVVPSSVFSRGRRRSTQAVPSPKKGRFQFEGLQTQSPPPSAGKERKGEAFIRS